MVVSEEESNKKTYERDSINHNCGYWSVCEDHACGCSPSAKVNQGFDNEVYQNMKKDIQKQAEEYDL